MSARLNDLLLVKSTYFNANSYYMNPKYISYF